MSFNLNSILSDMSDAIQKNTADDSDSIHTYAREVMLKKKHSLEELAEARLADEISEEEFYDEVEREKKVLQAELLTLKIMGKAMVQNAVNAAMNVFINAVKLAI